MCGSPWAKHKHFFGDCRHSHPAYYAESTFRTVWKADFGTICDNKKLGISPRISKYLRGIKREWAKTLVICTAVMAKGKINACMDYKQLRKTSDSTAKRVVAFSPPSGIFGKRVSAYTTAAMTRGRNSTVADYSVSLKGLLPTMNIKTRVGGLYAVKPLLLCKIYPDQCSCRYAPAHR